MNGRHSRGRHTEEAARFLPVKRGEQFCRLGQHDRAEVHAGESCPICGAMK